jgi:UDP-glucuronate decarboxylase
VGKRVLITGGAGFIGLNLTRALVARGYQVTIIDNFSRGTLDPEFQELQPHIELFQHDLTQPIPDQCLGTPTSYDQVYHLAAVVGVATSNTRPEYVLRTNLLATINLLDWCARRPPGRLFFSSTSEVADGAVRLGLTSMPVGEQVPLLVDDPLKPRFSYAMSKMSGELLCLHYARAAGFAVRVGRYYNVYGPRMGYDHVIPQFIVRALSQQNPFSIYGAYQRRSFCYIDDAIDVTIRLMELDTDQPLIVNIGDDRETTRIIDLARRLLAIAEVTPELDVQPPPPGSPELRHPNIEQLRRLTGYQPQVDLDHGLRLTYQWYRQEWQRQLMARGNMQPSAP